ncbi:MAG TPA: hypothetical protein VII44_04750, partial [Puia sp.]
CKTNSKKGRSGLKTQSAIVIHIKTGLRVELSNVWKKFPFIIITLINESFVVGHIRKLNK